MTTLTQEKLISLMSYDANEGVFIWRVSRGKARPGKRVGSLHHDGYITTMIDGREYGAHRLVWLYVYGRWPTEVIDHINGDRSDNRLSNLRDVSRSTNQQNRQSVSVANKSCGLIGATRTKGRKKYRAVIQAGGKSIHIGVYNTAQEAHEAYVEAKRILHAGCTI